jgi:RNA polymerase sigma factor (TIGR02999 family)
MSRTHEVTELLQAWSNGDAQAFEKLMVLVEDELRKIAHSYMVNERAGHTLQTTALVNEALIRLMEGEKINWHSPKQFYALVARRMRQVLIEHARAQLATKRGARVEHVEVNEAISISGQKSEEILMLGEALTKLAKIDERKAMIVEYRYCAGFTIGELAAIFKVAPSTIEREWRLARSWLKREMT